MTSNNHLSEISFFDHKTELRPRPPDTSQSPHQISRNRRRRHTLPSKFQFHRPNTNHPYFSKHTHHLCNDKMNDSIDTTTLDQGIVFYQNSDNGEVDFYWDNDKESEICAPSLMPGYNEMMAFNEVSGDSTDLEEKYFNIMARELNKQKTERVGQNAASPDGNLSPAKIVCSNETTLDPTKDMGMDDQCGVLSSENNEQDIDGMVKQMNELLNEENQELKEREEEEAPSPMSPRDPEREGLVLSEEVENTEEGAFYRLEHDPEFQDEAGMEEKAWSDDNDDEGMDPMENQ